MAEDAAKLDFDRDKYALNDLLYFLDFKRKGTAVNDVVLICESFYALDEIVCAKKELFDLIGNRHNELQYKARRGDNPSKAHLEDMINAMNKCDNSKISLPTFLSSNPLKVPQNNDGSVTLNQIMFMLATMRKEIDNLNQKHDAKSTNDPVFKANATNLGSHFHRPRPRDGSGHVASSIA